MVGKIREFFNYGIMTNVWLWFHMFFGGLFAFFVKKPRWIVGFHL